MDYTDIIAEENEPVKAPKRKPCGYCEGLDCARCKHYEGGSGNE